MRRAAALAALVLALPAAAAAGGSALLGGFQPVAIEDGARSIWSCPAAVASRNNPQLLLEGVFREQPDGSHGEISSMSLAASAPGRAYAWQLEFDDVAGLADWTLAAAQVIGRSRGPRLGTTVEYRGGEDNTFDAVLGAFAPMGRNLRAAGAVEDLFRADVDGVPMERAWRAGLAARGRHAWASWDWRGREHERGRNLFGAGIEAGWLFLQGAVDTDGSWYAAMRLVSRERTVAGGWSEPDAAPGDRWAAIELGRVP